MQQTRLIQDIEIGNPKSNILIIAFKQTEKGATLEITYRPEPATLIGQDMYEENDLHQNIAALSEAYFYENERTFYHLGQIVNNKTSLYGRLPDILKFLDERHLLKKADYEKDLLPETREFIAKSKPFEVVYDDEPSPSSP